MGKRFISTWQICMKWKIYIDIFYGVSCNIPHITASLDSTWKSRFSQISTWHPAWGVYSTTFDPELRNEVKNFSNLWGGTFNNFSPWTQKWKIYIDIFYGVSCNINHITAISNLYFQ